MSQLLVPGRRITSLGALPKVPLAGSANAAGLSHWIVPVSPLLSVTGLRSPLESVGLPTMTSRASSPPPVMSAPVVVVKRPPVSRPLAVIPRHAAGERRYSRQLPVVKDCPDHLVIPELRRARQVIGVVDYGYMSGRTVPAHRPKCSTAGTSGGRPCRRPCNPSSSNRCRPRRIAGRVKRRLTATCNAL